MFLRRTEVISLWTGRLCRWKKAKKRAPHTCPHSKAINPNFKHKLKLSEVNIRLEREARTTSLQPHSVAAPRREHAEQRVFASWEEGADGGEHFSSGLDAHKESVEVGI